MVRKYNSIDIGKFVAAIMVVAIHTNPMLRFSETFAYNVYNMLVSLAVPFFFMVSSYLFFSRHHEIYEKENLLILKQQIFKWIRLYLIWTMLYLPCTLYAYYEKGYTMGYSIMHFVRGLILIGHHNYSWPLWYLLALIYAMALCYIMFKRKWGLKRIVCVALGLFFLGIVINYMLRSGASVSGAIALLTRILNVVVSSGRIFISVLYIVLGMLLAVGKMSWLNKVKWKEAQVCICGVIRCIVPEYIDEILKVYMVVLILNILLNCKLKDGKQWQVYRRVSTAMFYCHMFFYFVWLNVIEKNLEGVPNEMGFIFVLACSIIAGGLVWKSEQKGKCWTSKIL